MSYSGDLSLAEAWNLLSNNHDSVLIDVRTQEEWNGIGVPDLASLNKQAILLPWALAPDYRHNPEFLQKFTALELPLDTKLLFICKAGGRSAQAASTIAQLGYTNCHNVAGGFDGNGVDTCWKSENLPWKECA